ncbi:hypothetical protein CEXT_154191 [Caerostris extrusa]|uniref:Uncharacterized protein n=1 Tax=Caerostris extrusa TaxID=172846 RepID=A0AAV4Y497_CAEEX|nr:hypothetical protein CEXT_154191 [Caerostris extrusa]
MTILTTVKSCNSFKKVKSLPELHVYGSSTILIANYSSILLNLRHRASSCPGQRSSCCRKYRIYFASSCSGRPSTALLLPRQWSKRSINVGGCSTGECSAREVFRGRQSVSVWKALRITLKRYPYKLQQKQELKTPDFDSQPRFYEFGIQ